jgi:hypothetical protein
MSDQTTARDRAINKFTARQLADYPYVLHYTRRGGRNTGVGLQVSSRVARSREDAEAELRRMENVDAAYGHGATYEIQEQG